MGQESQPQGKNILLFYEERYRGNMGESVYRYKSAKFTQPTASFCVRSHNWASIWAMVKVTGPPLCCGAARPWLRTFPIFTSRVALSESDSGNLTRV